MVKTPITHLSKWEKKVEATAEEEYEGFRNVLDWTEGFGLVFVECSPVQGSELIEQIKQDLPNKRVEILRFQEGEEIRNLYNLVEKLPNRKQIDILFIRGLEYSFVPYIKPGYGGQGDYYKLDNLPPILGHLNLQRERFRKDFNICFVFLLPFFGIKYFIQRAPDFFDWRLGLFRVPSKKDLIELETYRLIGDADYEQYCQWNFSQRMTRILEIEALLKEDLEPEDKSSLLLEQGNLWVASSAYKEAITSYDNALKNNSDDPDIWYNRGIALSNLGRYAEAITSYDQALKNNSDDPDIWYNRGIALSHSGGYEEAISSFNNVLKSNPKLHEVWNNHGVALSNLGRYKEALVSLDKAISIIYEEFKNSLYSDMLLKKNESDYNKYLNKYLKNREFILKVMGGISLTYLARDSKDESYYEKACKYALENNVFMASYNLKRAIEINSEWKTIAKHDSRLDKIRNDRRFIDLLNQSDSPS